MTQKTRPDMSAAMAAFLARGGAVTKTAPATAEVQRDAARAYYRAARTPDVVVRTVDVVDDVETEEARHIRIHREHLDAMADAAARARGDV